MIDSVTVGLPVQPFRRRDRLSRPTKDKIAGRYPSKQQGSYRRMESYRGMSS